MWACGLDWADPGQRQVAYACECGDEPSSSVKCGEFLDQLQTSQLFRKDSAPWSKYVVVLCCAVQSRCPSSQCIFLFFRVMSIQTKHIAIRWSKKGLCCDTSMPDLRSQKYTQGMKASFDDPLQMHLVLDQEMQHKHNTGLRIEVFSCRGSPVKSSFEAVNSSAVFHSFLSVEEIRVIQGPLNIWQNCDSAKTRNPTPKCHQR